VKLSGPWLEATGTQALLDALSTAGFRALFVGGCVRNALLKIPVADVDIATDADPETVTKIATNAGFKVVPTGIEHGTVTVIGDGVSHEVTTFRRDVHTNGRHAIVAFTTDLAEDAMRRDFTMNALYAQADGTVVDPLSGMADVLAGRVRFMGDAAARITEDYLRILRFFRFHAIYGNPKLGIDAEGLAASAANLVGLEALSRERVGSEIRKLLSAVDPAPATAAMEHAGVLASVLPGATARALPVLVHLENGSPSAWICRLAVMGGEEAAAHLKLSRIEAGQLDIIRNEAGSMLPAEVLGWKYGAVRASEVLYARAAVTDAPMPVAWSEAVAKGAEAVFPVHAADLMPKLQGADLGQRLKSLEKRWLESGLTLSREQLLM
jgi:poly(A) polymerase